MTKGNKIRLIVWGFIWLLILSAYGIGIYSYYNGYGVIGKIRNEIKPIVNNFNNLNGLNIYKNAGIDIKAKLSGKNIIITYKTYSSNLKFEFNYKEINNNKVLYCNNKNTQDNITTIVVKELLEAISIYNKHTEGEIFNYYDLTDFYNMNYIDDGITIKKNNSSSEIYININKSVADAKYKKEIKYVTEDELSNMNTTLVEYNLFKYTKENIILYLENTEEKYIVYAQNTSYDNILYKSIISVINTLDLDSSIKNDFNTNYPQINTSKEFGNYIIEVDSSSIPDNVFQNKNNIIKIEITKTKELQN